MSEIALALIVGVAGGILKDVLGHVVLGTYRRHLKKTLHVYKDPPKHFDPGFMAGPG